MAKQIELRKVETNVLTLKGNASLAHFQWMVWLKSIQLTFLLFSLFCLLLLFAPSQCKEDSSDRFRGNVWNIILTKTKQKLPMYTQIQTQMYTHTFKNILVNTILLLPTIFTVHAYIQYMHRRAHKQHLNYVLQRASSVNLLCTSNYAHTHTSWIHMDYKSYHASFLLSSRQTDQLLPQWIDKRVRRTLHRVK